MLRIRTSDLLVAKAERLSGWLCLRSRSGCIRCRQRSFVTTPGHMRGAAQDHLDCADDAHCPRIKRGWRSLPEVPPRLTRVHFGRLGLPRGGVVAGSVAVTASLVRNNRGCRQSWRSEVAKSP